MHHVRVAIDVLEATRQEAEERAELIHKIAGWSPEVLRGAEEMIANACWLFGRDLYAERTSTS